MTDLEQRVLATSQLPTLPTVAVRLLELSRRPEANLSDLLNVIKVDPATVSRILRTANSAQFGVASTVASLDRAVAVLGSTVVKSAALSFSLTDSSMNCGPLALQYR